MITIYGEGRGFRVAWMIEDMGLPYRLVDVDLMSDEHDADFLAINPSVFIPALRDGDVTMLESIAILEYLAARHGPTALVPASDDPTFPTYKQFLLMGEAGLASATFYYQNLRRLAPDEAGAAAGVRFAHDQFASRLALVSRQLERTPFVAGGVFTAADISVTYGLNHGEYNSGLPIGGIVRDYLARVRARPAYARALDTCWNTKALYASASP